MASVFTAPASPGRLNWRKLVRLTDAELGRCDIAAVNLACAEGLPGADEINVELCLARLDGWATAVDSYTRRLLPQFRRKPEEYENSEAYHAALCLVTVLQRNLGVKYNPAKIPTDAPFDTADAFIHGVIQGDGGTCATLPVVYAAVGRRLGYPIKLVATQSKDSGHLFARWDDLRTGERFNIEASGRGLTTPTDDYFRGGLYHLPSAVEKDGEFLQSQTPRQEMAGFLKQRAWRWHDVKDWRQCAESWAWALVLAPENKLTENSLKTCLAEWDRQQERRKPASFPPLMVQAVCRQFPATMPLELEKAYCGVVATENMLSDPRIEERHWKRMRRGEYRNTPTRAVADFAADGKCQVNLLFD